MQPESLSRHPVPTEGRLRREGQQPESFVTLTDLPLDSLIVIGASAGGHRALQEVVRGLSHDLPAAVVILLHSSLRPVSGYGLEKALCQSTQLPVGVIQEHGERLEKGRIYVAPPGYSAFLDGRTLQIEPIQTVHPVTSINRLFESAATAYHDRVIGVVLTGLLRDGTEGLRTIHEAGGLTIVQDPVQAEYSDMPTNAMQDLLVTFCLNLAEIGPALDLLVRRQTALETGLSISVRMLKERMALFHRLLLQSTKNIDTTTFLKAEMAALESDLLKIQTLTGEKLT